MADLRILPSLVIPEQELSFSFARAGGPGGQHVNTASTKVELRFDVDGSPSLTDGQKALIRAALGNRISDEGVLILAASEHRSQARNREAARERFVNLLRDALHPRAPRRPTKPSRRSRQRRLEGKRRRSELKNLRRPPDRP